MNFEEYNALGRIVADGWGESKDETAGAFKIIAKIVSEDRLRITCMIVVNLLNRHEMQSSCKDAYEQCQKACNEKLKQIKKDFKKETGSTLKTKELGHDESVELMGMSGYSSKGTALVRGVYNFEVK